MEGLGENKVMSSSGSFNSNTDCKSTDAYEGYVDGLRLGSLARD